MYRIQGVWYNDDSVRENTPDIHSLQMDLEVIYSFECDHWIDAINLINNYGKFLVIWLILTCF